jgi:hypothetical protein
MTKLDGELVPWVVCTNRLLIRAFLPVMQDRDAYRRLRYNVMKVLPYARFAGQRYASYSATLPLPAIKASKKN